MDEAAANYLSANAPPSRSRYAPPKTAEEVDLARQSCIPKKTKEDTRWCISIWNDWSKHRNNVCTEKVPIEDQLSSVDNEVLAYAIERFVLEVRNSKGDEYAPSTLHHLVCGIMRHLRVSRPTLDFFADAEFHSLRQTLDGEMKRLQAKGIGTSHKKAEIITEAEEELLWQKGVLGDSSPEALLNSIFYMCGMFFALRSGYEHRNLPLDPNPQIQLVDSGDGGPAAFLHYREDVSKNRQGGLKGRKLNAKEVRHYSNAANQNRCFVRLYKLYLSKLPESADKSGFYFKPLVKWSMSGPWYSRQPLGHNSLSQMMAKMCKKAGITGFKTNHSLRATAASRLYHQGLDEQLIMERTGHRSLDGVRSYKRTSDEQQKQVSTCLQNNSVSMLSSHVQSAVNHSDSVLSGFQITNCTGVTINITTST